MVEVNKIDVVPIKFKRRLIFRTSVVANDKTSKSIVFVVLDINAYGTDRNEFTIRIRNDAQGIVVCGLAVGYRDFDVVIFHFQGNGKILILLYRVFQMGNGNGL